MDYTETIRVYKKNEVYLYIDCSEGVAKELNEYFSFEAKKARFDPRVRNKIWDGKIRLFSLFKKELYVGLYLHLHEFCKARSYKIEKVETEYGKALEAEPVTYDQIESFCDSLHITDADGEPIDVYDFQLDAIFRAVKYHRRLFLSPTSSGKSLIIYCIIRALLAKYPDLKILIVVPQVGLVTQLHSDFKEYSQTNGWDVDANVAKVHVGMDKDPKHAVTITTYQSAIKHKPEFFKKYGCLIGDEAHQFEAKSLVTISNNCVNAKFRVGTTGSLNDSKTSQLVLEGIFGPVCQVATTKELQDRGIVAQLKIKCVVLKHNEEERRTFNKMKPKPDYAKEMDILVSHEARNRFIAKLAIAQTKNTLVLYRLVRHGKALYDLIKKLAPERPVFLISGGTDIKVREQIRRLVEQIDDGIFVCSYGTFSQGINMKNLHYIVMGSPYKSRVKVLQSIGRGLRLHKEKLFATLFDIGDNLVYSGSKPNYSLDHMMQRIDLYNAEQFNYTITEVPI